MSEETINTFSAYLGQDFQQKLMWQLLVEPEFAEKTIGNLAVEYFDDPHLKRLFIVYLEYFKEFGKVPNLQNKSIGQAIAKYKSHTSTVEEDILLSVVDKIKLWNERVINKGQLYDGDVVQKDTNNFIKQQEYRKLGELIIVKTKNGEIKQKNFIHEIDDKVGKIIHIGDEEDFGTEVNEGVENVLRKEFRQTIPTGVLVIDELTGGGLGKGEFGLILAPSGVGKTTFLTKVANTAYENGKNVLHIVFEDTEDQIKRKHYTIWSGIKLSEIDDKRDIVLERVNTKINKHGNKGKLVIKKFPQDSTTVPDIKNWILRYQKKFGVKFDIIVLDYLDKLESHKPRQDRNEAELSIVKAFEAMAAEFNIPCWSAIQSNRSGLGAEFVDAHQTGGNIKRYQIAHFFMSVAKTDDQKESQQANIKILKARFAQDGQIFENCIFNNDTMEIRITDSRYNKQIELKKHGEEDLEKLEEKASGKYHGIVSKDYNYNGESVGDVKKEEQSTVNLPSEIPVNTDFENKSTNISDKQFSENVEELSSDDKNSLHHRMMKMRVDQGNIRKG